jgi:hypothetical protein
MNTISKTGKKFHFIYVDLKLSLWYSNLRIKKKKGEIFGSLESL